VTWEQFLDHVQHNYSNWPTPAIVAFEVAIIVAAGVTYRFFNARMLRVRQHFILVASSVFAMEFFTAPMWFNLNLGVWGYVYSDVSWVLTLAWTTMILWTVYGVDEVGRHLASAQRFALYVLLLTPQALLFEAVATALGIRAYSPETLAAAGPGRIPILNLPTAGLYYIPVFMTLVLSLYKYWLPAFEPGRAPGPAGSLLRRLALTIVGVFLFEIMVEPMATNLNFPTWSYVFHDITIVMTGFWVLLVTLATYVIDRLIPNVDFRLRFAAYLALLTAVAVPIEGWFIQSGYRVYGPTATSEFLGFRTLIGDIPLEVVAAIPLYLALVISFVRYWDGGAAQGLGLRERATATPAYPAIEGAAPILR
jgi:hypothetical protein